MGGGLYLEAITEPLVYHNKKTIFNCFDYPICFYLTQHKTPYQYIYSKNWKFYYHSISDISYYSSKNDFDPKQEMLKEICGVNMRFFQYKSLIEVLKKESGFIVTQADGWYLPWAMNYKREHNNHWFSIVDHCLTESKVQVIDKIPEHNGWEDLDIINEGFIKSGSKCFKLTEVNFNIDVDKVIQLLTLNYYSIVGTSPIEGLNGLRAFRGELADLKNQSVMYIENWWKALKYIIDYRNQFVEYLSFLVQSNDSIIKGYPRIGDLSIIFAKTVNKWISFRHGLMRSFINKTNDYEKAIQRLDNIILFEEKCANELNEILQLWGYKVNETKMGSM